MSWITIARNISIAVLLPVVATAAPDGPEASRSETPRVSPARGIERSPNRPERRRRPADEGVRSIDGSGNNRDVPSMGASHTDLLRLVEPEYDDGVSSLAGPQRASARAVSNAVADQRESIPNALLATDFLWQWGQFLDHDIDLTDGVDPPEPADIPVPLGDAYFDPEGAGDIAIAFNRSIYDPATGSDARNPRQQLNEISSWIDASNVYGSDAERSAALRTNDGTGRLRTSEGNLLPFNETGLPNAGGSGSGLFLAGDVRANEQVGLTALHTLFVREHNRLVAAIAAENPELGGDALYERARRIVGAEMQVITYREYLPALLGRGAIARYTGYDPEVDARIANLFSGALYRYGHSALSPTLLRLDDQGQEIAAGHLALRDAFFSPWRLVLEGGVEPILRGLATQRCQAIDPFVVDDVRNFLFGEPGAGGFDLAALNIQRGRDHGLPSYNATRRALGLGSAESFADLSSDPEIQARLASVYDTVEDIDLWVGGLAEDPLPRSHVGELVFTVLKEQFEALRDGDRFWWTYSLDRRDRALVARTRLSDVIRRNSEIGDELPDDVFHAGALRPSGGERRRP